MQFIPLCLARLWHVNLRIPSSLAPKASPEKGSENLIDLPNFVPSNDDDGNKGDQNSSGRFNQSLFDARWQSVSQLSHALPLWMEAGASQWATARAHQRLNWVWSQPKRSPAPRRPSSISETIEDYSSKLTAGSGSARVIVEIKWEEK